jgi:hemolysin activation/secretion protein
MHGQVPLAQKVLRRWHGAHSAGRYETVNIDLQRSQRLSNRWNLLLSGQAQLASRNLDAYQKFVLGGPEGLRGYPTGEGTGDQDWLACAELSYAINSMLIPGVFYDLGGVMINKHPYLGNANTRALHDAGVGIHGGRSVQLERCPRISGGARSAERTRPNDARLDADRLGILGARPRVGVTLPRCL